MKKFIGIGIAAAVIAALACVSFMLHSDAGCYYTQVDNSKVQQVNPDGGVIDLNGGMSYSYRLSAYNEKGEKKDIKFGTEKKLRESAFICLTVKPVQGVVDWKEVPYDELPQAVQSNYTAP